MSEPRHLCIICGKKRYESKMKKVFGSSWACVVYHSFSVGYCYEHPEVKEAIKICEMVSKWKHLSLKHLSSVIPIRFDIVLPDLTISQGK